MDAHEAEDANRNACRRARYGHRCAGCNLIGLDVYAGFFMAALHCAIERHMPIVKSAKVQQWPAAVARLDLLENTA